MSVCVYFVQYSDSKLNRKKKKNEAFIKGYPRTFYPRTQN